MKHFFKASWPLAILVFVLWGIASICYLLAYDDPRTSEKRVNSVIQKLDDMYARQVQSAEKRDVIFEEVMHEHQSDFSHYILAELATASFVAGLLILFVDSITRFMTAREFREHSESISKNVWNAIFERMVPEPVATEIVRLLKSDICRIRPQYTITFPKNPYPGVPKGYVVVRRQLYYRLFNITQGQIKYPLSLQVISHTPDVNVAVGDGPETILPKICRLRVNGTDLPISDRMQTAHTITLPAMQSEGEAWEVFSEVEELLEVSDRSLYILTAPCYGLELTVINQCTDLIEIQTDKVTLTNGRDRLRQTVPGKWVCEGGLLSGTALVLSWRPPEPAQPALTDHQ